VAEWARLLWRMKGSVDEARQVFQKNQHWYLESRAFWINYLMFELEQPTSASTELAQHNRIRLVVDDIRRKSHLPPLTIKDLVHYYLVYLLERGTKDAAREYMALDREINGPFSVQSTAKAKLAEDGKESTTERRMISENGHPGVAVNEAAIRKGENPYTKYYQEQGELNPQNGNVSIGQDSQSQSSYWRGNSRLRSGTSEPLDYRKSKPISAYQPSGTASRAELRHLLFRRIDHAWTVDGGFVPSGRDRS